MDEITKHVLQELSRKFPGHKISLTHQFLDGTEGKECGFVPVNPTSKVVEISGQWWRDSIKPNPLV